MKQRTGSHSVSQAEVHLVWSTKYRYHVLTGDVQLRCRDLLRQTCNALDVRILKGVVSKDHIHLHVSYPPSLALSELMRRLKGRSAKLLLQEFPGVEAAILGWPFLGNWLWCLEWGQHHGRAIGSVSEPSQRPTQWGREFYSGIAHL